MPAVYPVTDIQTSLLFLPRRRPAVNLHVRPACCEDKAEIQRFFNRHAAKRQFYPHYDFFNLELHDYYRDLSIQNFYTAWQGKELLAICGVWDQSNFKQTRVTGYSPAMAGLRHFLNAIHGVIGGPLLPARGELIQAPLLHSLLVKNDSPEILTEMLAGVIHYLEHYTSLAVGFVVNDPLLPALKHYRQRRIFSRCYLASYQEDPRRQLDGRLPYIEIARL